MQNLSAQGHLLHGPPVELYRAVYTGLADVGEQPEADNQGEDKAPAEKQSAFPQGTGM